MIHNVLSAIVRCALCAIHCALNKGDTHEIHERNTVQMRFLPQPRGVRYRDQARSGGGFGAVRELRPRAVRQDGRGIGTEKSDEYDTETAEREGRVRAMRN